MSTLRRKSQPRICAQIAAPWLAVAFGAVALWMGPGLAMGQNAPAGPQAGTAPSDQASPQSQASVPARIGGNPNLAGTWALNKDQSDDPRQKMQQAGGGGGERGGGGGGGGRRGMGGGQGQGRGGGMMAGLSQLTIQQTESSVKVTGESGQVLAVYSGNDATSNKANSNTQANSQSSGSEESSAPPAAQWQGNQLVTVTQRRRGSTTRTFELSPDGKQLYLTTKIDNPRFEQPVTIRFVYDAAKAEK
jgi:hypothetical protein